MKLKSMLKILVALVLLFSFNFKADGQQKETYPGYVVLVNKEKIKGDLIFEDREMNPLNVTILENEKEKVYSAAEIESFEITGKAKFMSRRLKYCINPHRLDDLIEDKKLLWKEEKVFLKVLLTGQLNLYEYIDEDRKLHIVLETREKEFIDLINLKYLQEGAAATIPKYRNQLKRQLNDCQLLFGKIDKMAYKLSSIRKLIKEYHECIGAEIEYESLLEGIGRETSILGGISIANHFIRNSRSKNESLNLSLGVRIEHILPRNHKVWSIITGIDLRSYVAPLSIYREGEKRLDYLRLNIGAKRIFSNRALKWYGNFGVTNSLLIAKPVSAMRSFEQAAFVGLGVSRNKFSLEAIYEISNGYSSDIYLLTKVRTIFIRAGYVISNNEFSR